MQNIIWLDNRSYFPHHDNDILIKFNPNEILIEKTSLSQQH